MPDIEDIIESEAALPASSSSDGQSASGQPLGELVKVANRKAGQDALTGTNANGGKRSGWGAMRAARVIPPGSV